MKLIKDLILDEERALYNQKDVKIKSVKFQGPKDGESALKECENIEVESCYFDLRYPFWHVDKSNIKDIEMSVNCRAALWYCNNINIEDSKLHGIKAVRECNNVIIKNTDIQSMEFGWKCNNVNMDDTNIVGEYLFLDSNNIKLNNVNLKGKYSFQYVNDLEIWDSNLDTKDAFWHAKDVIVINTVLKGEYLGWYSENLTLINCKIKGTQPLCYCKNLKLINCTTEGCDLSFENSGVEGVITGHIDSIKNLKEGTIVVGTVGEVINDDQKYGCCGKVVVTE